MAAVAVLWPGGGVASHRLGCWGEHARARARPRPRPRRGKVALTACAGGGAAIRPRAGGGGGGEHASKGGGPAKVLWLVDFMSLCYDGSTPDAMAAVRWMRDVLHSSQARDGSFAPVVAVFDGERGNTARREIFAGYKAGRRSYKPLQAASKRSQPLDLRLVLPILRSWLPELNIPVVQMDDSEADDVIATLCTRARDHDHTLRVVVVSGDTDFRQLLSPEVCLCVPRGDLDRLSFYTTEHFVKQHAYPPQQYAGMKILLGDATDRIPRIPGVAKSTALKLVEQFVGSDLAGALGKGHREAIERNAALIVMKRDLEDVDFKAEWLTQRDASCDKELFDLITQRLRSIAEEDRLVTHTQHNTHSRTQT